MFASPIYLELKNLPHVSKCGELIDVFAGNYPRK